MMKKIFCTVLVALFSVLLLTGCQPSAPATPNNPPEQLPEETTDTMSALCESLLLLDARISNPWSGEDRLELLDLYADTLDRILALPESFELHGNSLTGESFVRCQVAAPVFLGDTTVRLVEYGIPGDAIYYTVQQLLPDAFAVQRAFALRRTPDIKVYSPGSALLAEGDSSLILLLLTRHDDDAGGRQYLPQAFSHTDEGNWSEIVFPFDPVELPSHVLPSDVSVNVTYLERGLQFDFVDGQGILLASKLLYIDPQGTVQFSDPA